MKKRGRRLNWHICPNCGEKTTNGEDADDYCLMCEMQDMDQRLEDRERE
jgi:hypothetical protein